MFAQHEIPVAYSMVALAHQATQITPEPFQELLCYWTAFNNIYTTITENRGHVARFQKLSDGTIRTIRNGSVLIPVVRMKLKERDEIDLAFEVFSVDLKRSLILHRNTKFFVYRHPKWHGREIEFDESGQKLNGVINIRYTINEKHPVWSPIDVPAYERYIRHQSEEDDEDLLARQILFLIYTVRNNTFHGGKQANDANDLEVVEKTLPLLKMVVEYFMQQAS